MPIYLVDTSAWIFALRRNPVAAIAQELGKLLKQDELATCPLVGLELLGGAANESEYARLQARLRGLHRLDIDNQDWEAAARLAFDFGVGELRYHSPTRCWQPLPSERVRFCCTPIAISMASPGFLSSASRA